MKRAAILTTSVVAVAGACAVATLPPPRVPLTAFSDGTIPGIVHVHTNRSDGRSTPDEVASAAARAGLKFLVFTDHGDGTRAPEPPRYRSGVLTLDGVEISTAGGHYIALGMPASPYPLAGEGRDVVEDVRRLGGFGIAAHPDSPKRELRWSDWTAPIDGMEWVNPDTSWRVLADEWGTRFRLFAGLLHYPIRPAETLASLLTSSDEPIARWRTIANERRIVGIAGADAHANIALRNTDPGDTRFSLPLPGYEASFRMLSVHVTPERPLTGDAATDAEVVLRAIREGHLYAAIDGLAAPAAFEFSATYRRGTAQQGDELPVGGPVSLRVRSNAPPGFTTIVWRDGEMLVSAPSDTSELTVEGGEAPAVYRVEIRSSDPNRPRSWLLSNGIYVRSPESIRPPHINAAAGDASPAAALALFDGRSDAGWHIETDARSQAALDVPKTADGSELRMRFALGNTQVGDERAAIVWGTPIGHAPVNVADYDRLTFTARAERPMRISVQLRTGNDDGPLRRWQRSVYLDTGDQERTVRFADLVPSDSGGDPALPLDQISQVLFVVDTVNTRPGTTGRVWLTRAEFRRGAIGKLGIRN